MRTAAAKPDVPDETSQPLSQIPPAVATWEDEGGAPPDATDAAAIPLSGTPEQIEWAERIRERVRAEFDRVLASFRAVADRQMGEKRSETETILVVAEAKRDEVLQRAEAGYFIHDWQEITDQVRRMIASDPRYQAIKSDRLARRQR
jgi:hypothetical protein